MRRQVNVDTFIQEDRASLWFEINRPAPGTTVQAGPPGAFIGQINANVAEIDGEVLVRTRYISLDAYRRAQTSEADWLKTVAPIFRNAITTIENLFDPETVVLGGLASAGSRSSECSSWVTSDSRRSGSRSTGPIRCGAR
jgi:hypothetical protein